MRGALELPVPANNDRAPCCLHAGPLPISPAPRATTFTCKMVLDNLPLVKLIFISRIITLKIFGGHKSHLSLHDLFSYAP